MALQYYEALFALSLILSAAYVFLWHKHFDIHLTLIYAFVPIENLGYLLLARSQTIDAALTANKIIYIGGCYLSLFVLLCVWDLCHIRSKRWVRLLLFALSTLGFLGALTMGESPLFYKSADLGRAGGATVLNKEYGPLHTAFQLLTIVYFVMALAAMGYAYRKKKHVSNKIIALLFLPEVVSLACYFVGRRFIEGVDLIPLAYVVAQATYLLIVNRIRLYDVTDSAIDALVETGATGFVSFDLDLNYLGSNGTAKKIMPELDDLTVDHPIGDCPAVAQTVLERIEKFRRDETDDKSYLERNDRIYLVDVNHLYDGSRSCGYQLVFTDDTVSQRYNEDLQREVAERTAQVVAMHERLVLGMATMVESRDNSTGGHIRRTSDVVSLLMEDILADGKLGVDKDFCRLMAKAAPMHDLGKIAVDDAILRKPGRFTDEEFEQMKRHAPEGARIVAQILEGTDDADFAKLAENVAHYHHERWDGSGYPDGLAEEAIPLEARIMAVADVYDALVSKRVYKERMSFEKADQIIREGMGSQFDPQLEPYYLSARPRIEDYYRKCDH